jgi:hypothetical protein
MKVGKVGAGTFGASPLHYLRDSSCVPIAPCVVGFYGTVALCLGVTVRGHNGASFHAGLDG